jgi:hypothetical protein
MFYALGRRGLGLTWCLQEDFALVGLVISPYVALNEAVYVYCVYVAGSYLNESRMTNTARLPVVLDGMGK